MAGSKTTTEQETGTTSADAPVVKYVGDADVVRISANDWSKAKVEDQTKVEWNSDNEFAVPVSDLNKDALAVLRKDSRFKVPEA